MTPGDFIARRGPQGDDMTPERQDEIQEIFDRVACHLMAQGRRSQKSIGCLYRAPNGDKCAIGCLISDENYSPGLELEPLDSPMVINALMASGVSVDDPRILRLLENLQCLHDNYRVDVWEEQLRGIAKRCDLKFTGGSGRKVDLEA